MKIAATIAALLLASFSVHAQVRSIEKSETLGTRIAGVDCGTAFHNGDTITYFTPSGAEVSGTVDKAAKQFFLTREGQTWAASLDAKGDFHVIDPQGHQSTRTPMSLSDARLRAKLTRSTALLALHPCGTKRFTQPAVRSLPKCLNTVGFNSPAPASNSPGGPAGSPPQQTKDCIPDEYGDPNYWDAVYIGEVIDQMTFDATQDQLMCMQLKSSCMQRCNDGFEGFAVGCTALGVADPPAGLACYAGITMGLYMCEGDCSSTYPNC